MAFRILAAVTLCIMSAPVQHLAAARSLRRDCVGINLWMMLPSSRDAGDDVEIYLGAEITIPTYDGGNEIDLIEAWSDTDGFDDFIIGGGGLDAGGTLWDTQEDPNDEDVSYSAIALGFREGCPVCGGTDGVLHPEAPYSRYLTNLTSGGDQTGDLDPSFCTNCSDYMGRWLFTYTYDVIDQWGDGFYDAAYVSEDFGAAPVGGSNCGDDWSPGNAWVYGLATDYLEGCLDDCNTNSNCSGQYSQYVYVNGYLQGGNTVIRECADGYILFSWLW